MAKDSVKKNLPPIVKPGKMPTGKGMRPPHLPPIVKNPKV